MVEALQEHPKTARHRRKPKSHEIDYLSKHSQINVDSSHRPSRALPFIIFSPSAPSKYVAPPQLRSAAVFLVPREIGVQNRSSE